MKIHHIGYLVKDIKKAISRFEDLGFAVTSEVFSDATRGVDICFLGRDGYRIELVSPNRPDSDVAGLRKKIGNTPYHICYEVENLEAAIEDLRSKKYVVTKAPEAAVAFGGKRVCFLVNAQIGLIELLEV